MNKIYLIGDSTCHKNGVETYPQTGWGQVFNRFISDDYEVVDLAENGRSSKSFIDEGFFRIVELEIKKGDFLFIQFGHNDEKNDIKRHTDPFSTYQDNLLFYINTARKVGATPILLSSIYRRHFDENGLIEENCHGDYPKAMEQLAKSECVIYIDMCNISKDYLSFLGPEKSKELFMNFGPNLYPNYINGSSDNSHLREYGALEIARLLIEELKKFSCMDGVIKK